MSVIQATSERNGSGNLRCPQCDTNLPKYATFCGTCGTRIDKNSDNDSIEHGIADNYRITSLIRRNPDVQLFLAIDNQNQQPVVIRDIDITKLEGDSKTRAIEAWQQEYQQLQEQKVPDVMSLTDLRHFDGHLFTIAKWPLALKNDTQNTTTQQHPYTLEDLLQSGIGLPEEETAISWTFRLCEAVEHLHQLQITIGDLDPRAIVVSNDNYNGSPALMVSWLPMPIRTLLPCPSTNTSAPHFCAPEALCGNIEPASDIYSLGALLYLLLTGIAPEVSMRKKKRFVRSIRDFNARIDSELNSIVMRAIAEKSAERFESVEDLAMALLDLATTTKPVRPARGSTRKNKDKPNTSEVPPPEENLEEEVQMEKSAEAPDQETSERNTEDMIIDVSLSETPTLEDIATHQYKPVPQEEKPPIEKQETQPTPNTNSTPPSSNEQASRGLVVRTPSWLTAIKKEDRVPAETESESKNEATFIKRLQRFILGEQQHCTTAAALIETPLRVQPGQTYAIRIHVMGRNEIKRERAGLSGMLQGEVVHIEVRSALYQSYAYIVQQANVQVPNKGYAAEVTIPMHPLINSSTGRRERLHIFFMDEFRNPLYEKPFVIEIFISHLVQSGREGHNVLTIPI